jgi:calcineurin-like phosphoesterase family protein
MYPLCCIDIRNFLNQFYFFSDDHFQHPNVIDEALKKVKTPTTIGFHIGANTATVLGPAAPGQSMHILD